MNNKIYCKGGTGKMPVPPIYWYMDCILNFRKIDTFGYKQLVSSQKSRVKPVLNLSKASIYAGFTF